MLFGIKLLLQITSKLSIIINATTFKLHAILKMNLLIQKALCVLVEYEKYVENKNNERT